MKKFEKDCSKMNYLQKHYISFAMGVGVVLVFLMSASLHYHNPLCSLKYEHINQNVVCGENSVIEKTGYAELQSNLEKYIEEEKTKGHVEEVSVYYRDLNNGPIFGIEETADFAPASLLKLPMALIYFKMTEEGSDILEEKIYFREPFDSRNQNFASVNFIKPGNEYKIIELIESMLVNSDNDAYLLLYEYLDANGLVEKINETYLELGILAPDDAYDEVISVRRYASIFRALYNASYIEPKYSEMILSWLTKTSFKSGLANNNSSGIKISHKFGERFSEDGIRQLHDCGIVYFPDNPYLLCIMTKGKDFTQLSAIIRYIANTVSEEILSRKI